MPGVASKKDENAWQTKTIITVDPLDGACKFRIGCPAASARGHRLVPALSFVERRLDSHDLLAPGDIPVGQKSKIFSLVGA